MGSYVCSAGHGEALPAASAGQNSMPLSVLECRRHTGWMAGIIICCLKGCAHHDVDTRIDSFATWQNESPSVGGV